MTDDKLRAALAEWDAIEGSDLAAQFQAFIAAGKMADAIRAALAASATDEGAHGRISRDDHAACDEDCGIAWLFRREDLWRRRVLEAEAARPAAPALDAMTLGRAMDFVDHEDDALGIVGRGRKVDRIIAAYAALSEKQP